VRPGPNEITIEAAVPDDLSEGHSSGAASDPALQDG
jgi:hypothetical protein